MKIQNYSGSKSINLIFMRFFFFAFLFCFKSFQSQTIEECKERFNKYLNLKGSVSKDVVFTNDAIYLLNANKGKEFAIYSSELKVLSAFFENATTEEQLFLYKFKGVRMLSKMQLDSIWVSMKEEITIPKQSGTKSLQGIRIALDPGHFSSNYSESRIEGKFVKLVNQESRTKDTITLVEGQLTYLTADLLKRMLEDQGAKVLITRTQANFTAFNQSYTDWFRFRRFKVLDSLVGLKEITEAESINYKKLSKDKLFWHFFRDYELVERSRKINNFSPHLSIIIHYNVDDKNAPWTKATVRNNSMCFIPGGFATMDLKKTINKLHFLRLLVSDQIKHSEIIGTLTINAFQKNLKISTAKQMDADYLMKHSVVSSGDGVFCRNLILTRYVNSPLVYGESLYQDNNIECTLLNNCNYNSYGVNVPQRVYQVAKSYYEAVLNYFKDPKIRISGT